MKTNVSAYYTKYRKKKMKTGRVESVSMECQLVVCKKKVERKKESRAKQNVKV